ncbi:MAG TPA: mannose-1-phosphate guanyltransferase, partial [Actinomycetota bacterium]|nr:mannose-1-phosphate guanyltransferase [Actinomycetota bacterium]
RVGAEVLAVNAELDEDKAVMSREEAGRNLDQLAQLVRSSGADLGVMLDATGERMRLVDRRGRKIPLGQALVAFVDLISRTHDAPAVAVPVATSRVVEDIVGRAGGRVVWSGISSSALSYASREEGVVFAGAEGGGYIFPAFLPSYDALVALAKLLELLARTGSRLDEVIDRLPSTHVARIDVATPWEDKGAVMRRLVERLDGQETVTIDGVKAFRGRDWALVVPHPQEPLVRVWAESDGPDTSRELAGEFAALVEDLRG